MTSIAFEMGAVFMLAGMLMFGSAHGLIPRSVRNIGAPILICIALFGFMLWRFGGDLMANARANAAPWFATSAPATSSPATSGSATAGSSQPALSLPNQASTPFPARKPAAPAVERIVIREVVAAPAESAPPAPALVAEKAVEGAEGKVSPEAAGSSPYDSGVKKAVKSVGHFLHIGGKKKDQAPQP
ncbi:MAG TPA: hypothetical protein VGG72_11155 [Bryobacteraceae bacterium]|jgi:hypothetical protein